MTQWRGATTARSRRPRSAARPSGLAIVLAALAHIKGRAPAHFPRIFQYALHSQTQSVQCPSRWGTFSSGSAEEEDSAEADCSGVQREACAESRCDCILGSVPVDPFAATHEAEVAHLRRELAAAQPARREADADATVTEAVPKPKGSGGDGFCTITAMGLSKANRDDRRKYWRIRVRIVRNSLCC